MNDKAIRKLAASVDRPCSALAINCCQLSCCLPQNAFVYVASAGPAAVWMAEVQKANPNAKFRDLVVPGTHDSASYTIAGWKPFSAVGRTQNLTVSDQMLSGARYLDIRFAGAARDVKRLSIWHGCLEGGDLAGILDEIVRYLKNHVGEFLVLELVPEYGRSLTSEQKDIFLKLVKDTFGDMTYPGKNMAHLMENATLTELAEQKHQVVVLLHSRFFENYHFNENNVVEEYGFVRSDTWMRNRWHNTRLEQQLFEWNLEELDSRRGEKVLVNNQFVLTPGVGGASDIFAALIGQNSLQPGSLANRMYRPGGLATFFRNHADKAWNLIMLDFIERCSLTAQFAIALNFPRTLHVQAAAVVTTTTGMKPIDVTEKVKSFVCRERALFLCHIAHDLDLNEPEGTLTIAYKIGESVQVSSFEYDFDTQVLVSQFTTGQTTPPLKLETGSRGYVAGEQLLRELPSGANSPVYKVEPNEGGFEFTLMS